MPQAPADVERPATVEEVITGLAKKHGISPTLALAVARKESGQDLTNLNAVGDNGQAVGLFQLHPAAAVDTGVTNRADPLQNITGGITYLKQLNDRYGGDVNKILMAYNGGMDGVDKGTVSPQAQAYASDVLAQLSRGLRTQGTAPPAAATAGMMPQETIDTPPTTPPPPERPGLLRSMASAIDPRTPAGRENIAGAAGAIGMGLATEGIGDLPIVLPWVARLVGPVLGAATAGAAAATGEQMAGTVPPSATAVPAAGLRQGAFELGGRALMGGGRRVLGGILASRVGKAASEALDTQLATARQVGTKAVERVSDTVKAAVDQVKTMATAAIEATRAQETAHARGLTAEARQMATAKVAQTELDTATALKQIEREYDNLLAAPPNPLATGGAVRAAVGPGSPAKAALDAAGARVEEAATSGPILNIAPVKAAATAMAAKARPAAIFEQAPAASGIGFLRNAQIAGRGAAAAEQAAMTDQSALRKAIAAQLGVSEDHPLPGLLGQLQSAPDQLTFANAHSLKMLLDEAVNWDRVAKRHLERITKGVRIALRDTMAAAGHEAYETAAAAYHAMVPLYRKGVGKQILRAATENPDALAKTLDPTKPAQALAARELLLHQAAAGGDAATGQAAWDAVRSHFFYDKLLKGGVEGLSDRVQSLFTTHPEFAKAVLHDQASQAVVSNMDKLGQAFALARDEMAQQVASTKAAAKTTVAATTEGARQAAEQAIGTVKASQAARVTAARGEGAQAIRAAREGARAATGAIKAKQTALRESSLARNTMEGQLANVVRAVGLGPKSIWGALSLIRLLEGPKAAEISEWAVYSSKNTQRLVDVLHMRAPDRVAANLIRDLYTTLGIRGQAPEPPATTAPTAPSR